MRLISLIFILFAVGCTASHRPSASSSVPLTPMKSQTTQTRSVLAFNRINIRGSFHVNLYTGAAKSQVILQGNPVDLAKTSIRVSGSELLINAMKRSSLAPVTLNIYTRYLNALHYEGNGVIRGNNIHSSLLDLFISHAQSTQLSGTINLRKLTVKGGGAVEINGLSSQSLLINLSDAPKVNLVGVARISYLNLEGNGSLGLYWVKSDRLTIRAKNHAYLQLAGIANVLDIELWDNAHFNGRYLRADRTYAKTHDRSIAEITALKRQHTLATDASDIYFYKIPEIKADFMAHNGSVLDMRDWNSMLEEEYNRYNSSTY